LSHSQDEIVEASTKKFNGELTKWLTFWDSFESSIHNNQELSDVDKFDYLRTLLEGLTAANYVEAITVLRQRFGNKQQIISKHMDVLLSLEAVTSQYNSRGCVICMMQ